MLRLNNIKFYRSDSSLYFCCVVLHFLRKESSVRSHSWDPSSYREPPLQSGYSGIRRSLAKLLPVTPIRYHGGGADFLLHTLPMYHPEQPFNARYTKDPLGSS